MSDPTDIWAAPWLDAPSGKKSSRKGGKKGKASKKAWDTRRQKWGPSGMPPEHRAKKKAKKAAPKAQKKAAKAKAVKKAKDVRGYKMAGSNVSRTFDVSEMSTRDKRVFDRKFAAESMGARLWEKNPDPYSPSSQRLDEAARKADQELAKRGYKLEQVVPGKPDNYKYVKQEKTKAATQKKTSTSSMASASASQARKQYLDAPIFHQKKKAPKVHSRITAKHKAAGKKRRVIGSKSDVTGEWVDRDTTQGYLAEANKKKLKGDKKHTFVARRILQHGISPVNAYSMARAHDDLERRGVPIDIKGIESRRQPKKMGRWPRY